MSFSVRHIPAILTGCMLLFLTGCCLTPYPVYRSRPPEPQVSSSGGTRSDTAVPAPPAPKTLDEKKMMAEIESLFGVPYKYGGTTKSGMDCSGFTMFVYNKVHGIKLPHNAHKQTGHGRRISKRNLRFGDLVFFGKSVSSIDHVGIYLGNGKFAHASTSKGVTTSGLEEKYFKKRYRAAVRVLQ